MQLSETLWKDVDIHLKLLTDWYAEFNCLQTGGNRTYQSHFCRNVLLYPSFLDMDRTNLKGDTISKY